MALLLDHLALDAPPRTGEAGAPLLLPIDAIDEDPDQPRREFDDQALAELAQTIAARGVRQPVSVRPHPQQPGRWMLNFGARRLRASRLAGKADIPAFVDATADSYDQVIENEHREGLKPMELALFVQKQMRTGASAAEIARRLGKSRAYLSYVCALVDAPEWLAHLYRRGKCRGVKELYDLRRLHERHADQVEAWLDSREFISRADVAALQALLAESGPAESEFLPEPAATPNPVSTSAARPGSSPTRDAPACELARQPSPMAVHARPTSPACRWTLWAEFQGRSVRVWLDPVPEGPDTAFVSAPGGVDRQMAPVAELLALRLVSEQG